MDKVKLDALVNESELHPGLFREDGKHFPAVYGTAIELLEQEKGTYTPGEGYFQLLLICFEEEAKMILSKNNIPIDVNDLCASKETDSEKPEIGAARRVLWLVWQIQYLQKNRQNDSSTESPATRLLTLFHTLLAGATEYRTHNVADQSR